MGVMGMLDECHHSQGKALIEKQDHTEMHEKDMSRKDLTQSKASRALERHSPSSQPAFNPVG
jgi:hypothetical protein